MPTLSLVIPLYNESKRIAILDAGLREFIQKFSSPLEIILVNDASQDDTLEKLLNVKKTLYAKYAEKNLSLEILNLKENMHKGGSLKAGVLKAKGKWILTLDADMATSPSQIIDWQKEEWLNLNENNSKTIFIGSREEENSAVKDKFYRRIMGRTFNFLVKTIHGINIKDTQCGFKLYPKEAAKECFKELKELGWAHDVEILKRAQLKNFMLQPLPVEWKAVPQSKINPLKDSLIMFFSLFKIYFYLKR